MKERPILFSAPMVRAILDGSKTQTRRIMKAPWDMFDGKPIYRCGPDGGFFKASAVPPYGHQGDRLWVRETWRYTASSLDEARAITEDIASGSAVDWRATYIETCMKELGFTHEEAEMADNFETWRPSIHMPRWASRILLEVTGVRVERLQDISEEDAWNEGVQDWMGKETPWKDRLAPVSVHAYAALWEQINGAGSWDANPWVWVIEFKRVDAGAMKQAA